MKNTTILSNVRNCFITITHSYSDPSSWIVKRWTKLMWFKKLISADWFNDEQQAVEFANKIKLEHQGKEMLYHAE
jgi:hypothetical protein